VAETNLFGFNVNLPEIGGNGGGFGMTTILLIVAILVIIGIVVYLIIDQRRFNRKIIVFENIAGQGFQPVYRDRARLVKLGDGGEELLFLKKKKTFRTAYGRKMGKNTFWFVIGQDGYWYNSILGDFDAKMGMLDIEPIDRDMRYMHVAVRKNIQDRYRKQGFMEKYGALIMNALFLLIVVVGVILSIKQLNKGLEALTKAMELTQQVQEQNIRILSIIDTMGTGGSGLVPA